MKKFVLSVVMTFVLLLITNTLNANSSYNQQAREIQKEIWGWDIPQFQVYEVPAEYDNESAVIIAKHRHIEALGKKSSAWRAFLIGDMSGKLFYTDVTRTMIKINDQAALDVYSNFSFKEKERGYGMYSNLYQTFVGARIIKSDGRIVEVDVLKDAVAITEGRKDTEAFKKLAIPDLQKGDILDYYFYDIYELATSNITNSFISFFSHNYPAMYYSLNCEFGKNVTVEYRSINGAPEVEQTIDAEGNYILRCETTDIKKIKDLDNLRWLSAYRSLPAIRLSVLQNGSNIIFKPKSARPFGVHKDVFYENLLSDAIGYVANMKRMSSAIEDKNKKKKINQAIEEFKLGNPSVTNEELALFIVSVYNLYWVNARNQYYNPATYAINLLALLEDKGIESKLAFSTSRLGACKEELFDSDDLDLLITTNDNKQIFMAGDKSSLAGEVPARFQGESISTLSIIKYSVPALGNAPADIVGMKGEYIIPTTLPEHNRGLSLLDIVLSGDDFSQIDITHKEILSGEVKREAQPRIFIYEQWDNAMRDYLGITTSYLEELNEKKRTRKYLEEAAGAFEKQKEELRDKMKTEVLIYHSAEPKELKEYEVLTPGVTPLQPLLEYEMKYTMDGFVKKAGENLILDIGRLIGTQYVPNDDERDRNVDVYLPSCRTFEKEVNFVIPEGYKANLTESLNLKMENKYGSFQSIVNMDGNILKVKTEKVYKTDFVPVADFSLLLDMLDAANDFYSKSVVLSKM